MQFRKEQAEQNAAEMLTDPEILERNNRLRNAVLRNREFTCGRYSIRMEYFMYYPERAPSETPVHTHPLWELSFLSAGEWITIFCRRNAPSHSGRTTADGC